MCHPLGIAFAWITFSSAATVLLLAVDSAAEKPVGRTVYYSGNVQGVGFRATAVSLSRDYPVTGWVKNLDDGRVQLVVEGPAQGVADFLEAVRKRWKANIEKEEAKDRAATGEFKDFRIAD